MPNSVNRMTNANVYLNGASQLGKAEEVDLPKIISKMAEHKALGMAGSFELPSGFDKMEARIKWNALYKDTLSAMANPFAMHQFQVRSSLEVYTGAGRTDQQPVVAFMRGQFKEVPGGNFKQHDNVELESRIAVTYFRMEVDGVSKFEFDVLANIYKVDGVDLLAQYRENLGI